VYMYTHTHTHTHTHTQGIWYSGLIFCVVSGI
jgi:hypothetical protein